MLHVKRAGHSTLTTPDIGRMVDYFIRIVGLNLVAREKDRAILATKSGLEAIALERGDFFAFLRCSRDHHTVNFLRDAKTAIHHIAFEVRDWSDIKRASDLLAKNKIKLTWGPLRHIIGHNIAIYHKDPDGLVIEFFC